MDDILKIAKNYSKEKHIELLPASENNILDSLLFFYLMKIGKKRERNIHMR